MATSPPALRPALLASVATIALAGVAYSVLFSDRTDYVGHLLAGAGGTYWLLAVVAEAEPGGRWPPVIAVWGAILLGVIAEATIFRLAEFDPVDVANQSIGAVIAGAGMLDARPHDRSSAVAGAAGLFLLIAEFVYAFA